MSMFIFNKKIAQKICTIFPKKLLTFAKGYVIVLSRKEKHRNATAQGAPKRWQGADPKAADKGFGFHRTADRQDRWSAKSLERMASPMAEVKDQQFTDGMSLSGSYSKYCF